MTQPLSGDADLLRQLIEKWRDFAAFEVENANHQSGATLYQCADELEAALSTLHVSSSSPQGGGSLNGPSRLGASRESDTGGESLRDVSSGSAQEWQRMADAAEMLWIVLANVSGGDWTKQSEDWQEYAAHWRDNYFAALKSLLLLRRLRGLPNTAKIRCQKTSGTGHDD